MALGAEKEWQMNQQEKTEGMGVCYATMPICRKTMTTELSGDYTLPDYQPELRRLLYVSGRALPPAKYVGGGSVELDGVMEYQILYVGADGGLYSAPLTGEYNLRQPMENLSEFDLNEGVCVLSSCIPESITARVTAPRKLTLRRCDGIPDPLRRCGWRLIFCALDGGI